ncbi:MAG: thioredoxin domain-containing protein [Bacteroidales bacterium]
MKIKNILLVFVLSTLLASSACSRGKSDQPGSESKADSTQAMGPIHLTRAEFLTKVVDFEKNPTKLTYLGDKPCIVDFYASWCGPCKMVSPIMEELAKEYAGRIYIYKVDTEKGSFPRTWYSRAFLLSCSALPRGSVGSVLPTAEETKAMFKKIIERTTAKKADRPVTVFFLYQQPCRKQARRAFFYAFFARPSSFPSFPIELIFPSGPRH